MPFFRSLVNWLKRAVVHTAFAELAEELESAVKLTSESIGVRLIDGSIASTLHSAHLPSIIAEFPRPDNSATVLLGR